MTILPDQNGHRRPDHGFGLLTYRGRTAGRLYRVGGRDVRIAQPELLVNRPWELMPWPVQVIERLVGVSEFLRMRAV